MQSDDSLFDLSIEDLERLPVGVITLDRSGTILYYNRAEAALSGMSADAVIGRRFFGDVAPCAAVRDFEGRFLAFAADTTTAAERIDFPFQFRWGVQDVEITMLRRARRPEIQLVVRAHTLLDDLLAGARTDGASGTSYDESYEFTVPYWTAQADRSVFWSDELRALLGAPPAFSPTADSLIGCVHPTERARMRRVFERSAAKREPFAARTRMLGFDGTIRYVLLEGGTYGVGETTVYVGTAIDVSDRRYNPTTRQSETEAMVRAALEHDRVFLAYQPIVDRSTSQTDACEALARIRSEDGTIVPPADFIAECERCGLIVPLGERILTKVVDTMRSWSGSPLEHLRVAVNVSSRQLAHPRFLPFVRDLLTESGIAPERLEFELTGRLPERFDDLLDALVSVKLLGIRITIDDFGTGYSSLAFIKYLPVDTIKIDRPLVAGLGLHPLDDAIVSTVVSLARTLQLEVIAEGVETERQAAVLTGLGVTLMQGERFCAASPLDVFEAHARGAR